MTFLNVRYIKGTSKFTLINHLPYNAPLIYQGKYFEQGKLC